MHAVVLGYGYWGPNWARTLSASQRVSRLTIIDPLTTRLTQARKAFPSANCGAELNGLECDAIDIAVIATPADTHLDLARRIISAGAKRVIIEKPLALNSADVEKLQNLAETSGTPIFVDYTYLSSAPVAWLKSYVDSRERTNFQWVASQRHNLGIFRPDSSVLWDLAVHDLSILDYLFGPLDSVSVNCLAIKTHGSEMFSAASLRLLRNSNQVFTIDVSWMSPAKVREISLYSESSLVKWDDNAADRKICVFQTEPVSPLERMLEFRLGDITYPRLDSYEALSQRLEEILNMEDEYLGSQEDLSRSRRITAILEAAEKSVLSEGSTVQVGGGMIK